MMLLLLSLAAAQDTCPVADDYLTGSDWLRALSLDLRGIVPSAEEYAALDASGEIPDSLIQSWLETPEFTDQVVRHHRALLTPNVADIRLLSNRQRLIEDETTGIWYRYLVAPNYRGGPVSCGDFEATWDGDGNLILDQDASGYTQEGWTWVSPYWDPQNPIKVCAYEAQEDKVSPWGTECDTYDGRFDPYCGCGPNLAWCDTPWLGHNGGNPRPPVSVSIVGDIEHRIAAVIQSDSSYLDILTGRTMYVNGPLAHFYRYQTKVPAHVRFNEVPVDPDLLPDIPFSAEDTWLPVEVGDEHAGILTSTFYLMKFQTRRGRANRFYNAFLCQPFQPPDGGISGLDSSATSLDLSRRDGCNYCHALLEPAGAHWGRWSEYGAGYLDPQRFPASSAECAWCAATGESCSEECSAYYVVDSLSSEEDPYLGWLKGYEFLEERHVPHVEEGPKLLVANAVADGRLPLCVAEKTASWLLGRQIEAWEEPWITELSQEFIADNYSYRTLVKEIVTSDNYRSVR